MGAFLVILCCGGDPELRTTDFRLYRKFEFQVFFYLQFLRRSLIAPDTATAGGSSPKICVDRACPGLILRFYRGGYCAGIHNPHVVWVFGKLHAQLGV